MTFADAVAAAVDTTALADLVASQTNDDMQALLLSRRSSGVPGGLGDSRAIRAAVRANIVEQMTTHVAALVAGIKHDAA